VAVGGHHQTGNAMTGLALFMADPWIELDIANADPAVAARWRLTTDRTLFADADVVIYPAPLWGIRPPVQRAHPYQIHVLWSQESSVHYPQLLDAVYLARFDLRMTYQLDSDVPIPYLSADMFDVAAPLPASAARGEVPISAWVSSSWDRCGRDRYLLELMEHIPVHSYGKVGQNRELVEDRGRDSKLAAITGYRFTIAFENSVATDYVTEKFFQPLVAGSVPIYRGAPNVADFAPAPHSYIDATDFSAPAELAEFLAAMTDDDYLRYHAWRAEGPTSEWRQHFAPFGTHTFVRLSQAADALRFGRRAAEVAQRRQA
jgi:hypothetical protein